MTEGSGADPAAPSLGGEAWTVVFLESPSDPIGNDTCHMHPSLHEDQNMKLASKSRNLVFLI